MVESFTNILKPSCQGEHAEPLHLYRCLKSTQTTVCASILIYANVLGLNKAIFLEMQRGCMTKEDHAEKQFAVCFFWNLNKT